MTPAPLPDEEIERLISLYEAGNAPGANAGAMRAWINAFHEAAPALLAEIEAGRAGAGRVREVPVKHLSTCGPFYARAMAWWAANMKSEAKAAFVTGDGYIRYSWDDGEESGSYSLPIAVLYGLPHEDAALRQAAQPSDAPAQRERMRLAKEAVHDACRRGDDAAIERALDEFNAAMAHAAPAQVGAQPAGRFGPLRRVGRCEYPNCGGDCLECATPPASGKEPK